MMTHFLLVSLCLHAALWLLLGDQEPTPQQNDVHKTQEIRVQIVSGSTRGQAPGHKPTKPRSVPAQPRFRSYQDLLPNSAQGLALPQSEGTAGEEGNGGTPEYLALAGRSSQLANEIEWAIVPPRFVEDMEDWTTATLGYFRCPEDHWILKHFEGDSILAAYVAEHFKINDYAVRLRQILPPRQRNLRLTYTIAKQNDESKEPQMRHYLTENGRRLVMEYSIPRSRPAPPPELGTQNDGSIQRKSAPSGDILGALMWGYKAVTEDPIDPEIRRLASRPLKLESCAH